MNEKIKIFDYAWSSLTCLKNNYIFTLIFKESFCFLDKISHFYIAQTLLNLICILSHCVTRKAGF